MSLLFVDSGVPLLRGQNVHQYSLDMTNLKYISKETHRKWKKSALQAGDVVIVRVGYPGTACVIPEGLDDLNAASLVIVRPNPDLLDSHYLCYVLNSPWGKAQIKGRLVGAAQQVFNTQTAAEFGIPLPSLPEQRAIVTAVQAVLEAKTARKREIKLDRERKAALMEDLFTRGTRGQVTKQSEIGETPNGWETRQLGDIFRLRAESVDPNTAPDLRYIGLEHIVPGEIGLKRWGKATEVKSAKNRFYPGDVLYGKLRPYLDKCILAQDEGVCSTDILVLTPTRKPPDVLPVFLAYLLHTGPFVSYAKATATGVNHPRTSWAALRKFKIPLPPLDEQACIAQVLRFCDTKIDAVELEISVLDDLFEAIQDELMTGRLSATNLIEDVT
jgi:type I restriction enzyme S subunit